MAVLTYQIASLDNGLAYTEIDIRESNLRVMQARVVNNSSQAVGITVKKSGNSVFHEVIASMDSIERNLPSSVKFSMDDGDLVWGYPPAMYMADIEIFFGHGEVY